VTRRSSVLLPFLVVAVSLLSFGQPQSLLTRHVREAVVRGEAQSLGRLPATQILRLDIVLALRHQPELDNFLQELYDPSSPSYRHFLTPEEFTARFGPSQEEYDAVLHLAAASGFEVIGGSRDAMDLQLKGTVASVEKAFHLTMDLYKHPTENRMFFAPDREPTVDLPFQLWHISGLDNYSLPHPMFSHRNVTVHSNVAGSCHGYYCGSDMRAAYYGGTALTGTGQNIALLELAGTDLVDLNNYYSSAGQTKPYTPTLVSEGGYSTSCLASNGCDDGEQTLDMTQAMGMAPGSTMLYMYVCGDAYGSGTFLDTACLGAMSTASPLSAQISSSWSWTPADPSTDDPYFKKFATQGQNFFQASGDNGSYPTPSAPFYYPAEDDFVTAVGGTDLQTTKAGGAWSSETAWADAGGGISPDSIAIPSWQQLSGVINSSNGGSKTLRNIPDVSAEANFDFWVCADQTGTAGCQGTWGGTSFAAPMWAGYMALVNQQAVANGNSTVGFINPTLYNIGVGSGFTTDFHDITSGGNGGFSAVTGYDLVTGWGSPNGANLITALAGSSGPSFTLSANPTSVTIAQGGNGPSTITVHPANGFTGSVTLSASGLPSGVTAAFNPNPTTTTSTLTLTASGSATTGTSTVTIMGTSGALTNQTPVQLTVTGTTAVTLSPASLTWANEVVGATSAAKTVTLTNSGAATLSISNIGTSGDFAVSSTTCASTLGVGKKCMIKVTFTPTQLGTRNGSLAITDNAPDSPQSVPLSGTGTTQATLTPATATYASLKVGTTSAAKKFTLSNKQPVASLTGISISTTGDFAVSTTTCGATLAPKTTCTISVTFTPTQTGTRTGTLQVSDSAVGSPQTSSLTGTGK